MVAVQYLKPKIDLIAVFKNYFRHVLEDKERDYIICAFTL